MAGRSAQERLAQAALHQGQLELLFGERHELAGSRLARKNLGQQEAEDERQEESHWKAFAWVDGMNAIIDSISCVSMLFSLYEAGLDR